MTLVAALAVGFAQDPQIEELRRLIGEQNRRIAELEKKLGAQDEAPTPIPSATETQEGPKPYSEGFLGRFGNAAAYVGGYVDLEYIDRERDRAESGFDPHRFVLLVAATVSENVKFWSEVEIEHGDEVGIEFSHVDILFTDWINLRAGIILEPLGRFNLEHDAPLNDLTDRPVVDQFIIPAVLRDAGVGLFGRRDWGQTVWSYEAYVTNGFEVLDGRRLSDPNPKNVLRQGRPHRDGGFEGHFDDFNDDKAVVGRLGFSPALGVDFGFSGYTGDYDDRDENRLNIFAVDFKLHGGALADAFDADGGFREFLFAHEWLVEFANADFGQDAITRAAGVPRDMTGFYAQWNYHFMPQCFLDWLGDWATDETTFTLVARYDDMRVGIPGVDIDDRRLTLGLNFRPTEATVIKFDYQIDVEDSDEGIAFSFATYF